MERKLLGTGIDRATRLSFREDTQKAYTGRMLTQEIMMEGRRIADTGLYRSLHERYVFNLKEKVLDPFLENENFRQSIKNYGETAFRTYDRKIREDVSFLIGNLCGKFNYTQQGAKEACIYVIDNDLARKFPNT